MNIIQGLLSAVSPQPDGDFSDRLNYCATTVGLVVASAFVSGWSFVGSPIQWFVSSQTFTVSSWFPAYFKGWWQEYALDYCYVQNTYYIPMYEKRDMPSTWDIGQHMMPIPQNDTVKEQHQIGYYQWVPFILAFQALFFYLPIIFWRFMYTYSGLKVDTILNTCSISSNMDEETRKTNMKTVAGFLVQDHTVHENYNRGGLRRVTTGTYIICAYLALKLMFALNAAVQFMLLKSILGVDTFNWGWDTARSFMSGEDWEVTGNFPRITLCDFTVRELGNNHSHTVQCVLMINMFNEKIFLALWFWLTIVFTISVTSLLQWAIYFFLPSEGTKMVNRYIHNIDPEVARSRQKKDLLNDFVKRKLRPDGIFLVRLIASNNGDMVAAALLKTLWDDFKKTRGERPPPYMEPLLLKNSKIDEAEL